MSLSRKLVQSLVEAEIIRNKESYHDLNIEKLTELANQVFLIQVTQIEPRTVKKSLQDKIEHFNAIMANS